MGGLHQLREAWGQGRLILRWPLGLERRNVRWAENEGSEKCVSPGPSPAYVLSSWEGRPCCSCPSPCAFPSDASQAYWPGMVKSHRKGNTLRLPKSQALRSVFLILKRNMQNSNHFIIQSSNNPVRWAVIIPMVQGRMLSRRGVSVTSGARCWYAAEPGSQRAVSPLPLTLFPSHFLCRGSQSCPGTERSIWSPNHRNRPLF